MRGVFFFFFFFLILFDKGIGQLWENRNEVDSVGVRLSVRTCLCVCTPHYSARDSSKSIRQTFLKFESEIRTSMISLYDYSNIENAGIVST